MVVYEEDRCEVEDEKHKHRSTVAVVDDYPELRKGTKISANHLSLRERNEDPNMPPTCSWMEKITTATSSLFLEIYQNSSVRLKRNAYNIKF